MEIIFVRHGQSTENAALDNNTNYDENNIILTKRGELQCKTTGKYLKDTFGAPDLIIHSPIKRCIQTAELIARELKHGKIITDDRLIELGNVDKFSGSQNDRRQTCLTDDAKYQKLLNKIENEKNPFNFVKLMYKANVIGMKIIEAIPNWDDHYEYVKSFLNSLKKYDGKYKRILVVSHGGTMRAIESIITGIPIESNIKIVSRLQTVLVKEPVPIIETNNCIIMCVLYEDNCYKIISPANNLHLLELSKSQ